MDKRQLNIYVIDDDEFIIEQLFELINESIDKNKKMYKDLFTIKVFTYSNPELFLNMIKKIKNISKEHYIFIIDYSMPISGFDVVVNIVNNKNIVNRAIYMYTANKNNIDIKKRKYLDEHTEDIIDKGIEEPDKIFSKIIKNYIKSKKDG